VSVSLVEEKAEKILAPVRLAEENSHPVEPVVRAVEPPEAVKPLVTTAPAQEAKPGILKWMFDPATSRGRFMRTFSRWAAIVIGLFALGFLVGYFALYQPVAQQLEDSRAETTSLMAQLKTTQEQMEAVQGELSDTEGLLLQAKDSQSESQAELAQLKTQRKILEILYDVTAARMAWMTNDRVVALTLLVNAEQMLDQVRPDILTKDAKLADLIAEQLKNCIAGIKSNAQSLLVEMQKLQNTMKELERFFGILSQ
jgi:archaellum component FlaC